MASNAYNSPHPGAVVVLEVDTSPSGCDVPAAQSVIGSGDCIAKFMMKKWTQRDPKRFREPQLCNTVSPQLGTCTKRGGGRTCSNGLSSAKYDKEEKY